MDKTLIKYLNSLWSNTIHPTWKTRNEKTTKEIVDAIKENNTDEIARLLEVSNQKAEELSTLTKEILNKPQEMLGDKLDEIKEGINSREPIKVQIEGLNEMVLRGEKGDKGDQGEKGDKGDKGDKGEDGKTPKAGKDFFTKEQAKGFLDLVRPVKGIDYFDGETGEKGEKGEQGEKGEKGDQGEVGPVPMHKVEDDKLYFENENGELDEVLDFDELAEKAKEKIKITAPVGKRRFIELNDTPEEYDGQAGKFVRVNSSEDGMEFIDQDDVDNLEEGTEDYQTTAWDNDQQKWIKNDVLHIDFDNNQINAKDNPLINLERIKFQLDASITPEEGDLYWDAEKGTLNLALAGGTIIQIAQEQVLPDRPRNTEAVQIDNGQAVYLSGATGAVPEVKLASASAQTAPKTLAVATQNVSAGNRGYYTTFGLVRDIDTSFGNDGDEVFLDTTAGELTTDKLDHPNFRIRIGSIIRSHATEGVLFVNIEAEQWLKRFQSAKYIYGFDYDQETLNGDISFDDGTRTFTISPQGGETYFNYWIKGKEYRKTTQQVTIDDTSGLWFIYFEGDTLTASQTPWTFKSEFAFVATVYWNATTNAGILVEERHKNNIPRSVHDYLHDSVGARYSTGMAGTFDDTTLSIESGVFYDEDIEHSNTQQTTAKVLYYNGASEWSWDVLSTPYKVVNPGVDDTLRYNNGTALASVDNSKFTCSWVYMTGDADDPVHIYIDDAQYLTVALARAATPRPREELTSPEDKFIYKIIYQNSGGTPTYIETIDYRSSQTLGSTYTPTDHGNLSGLTDDDHTQYLLADGTREYTSQVITDNAIVTVDDLDAADNDYAKFTANGIEGRSYSEVKSDLAIVAADISDFDTEVSNNTDVAANTAARHSAVTVTDSSEIDFTLTGQDITASLKSGSIDETKLDASTNASLDLADSALQNIVEDTTPQLGGTLDANGNSINVDTINEYSSGNGVVLDSIKLKDGNTITTTQTDHIAITPGTSKLVKTAVLRQDNTTNSYVNNSVILTGWGFVVGDDTANVQTETVNFGVTFSSAPVVTISPLGAFGGTTPTSITDFSSSGSTVFGAHCHTITTSSFGASLTRAAGAFLSTVSYAYSWTAIGQLN